MSEYRYHLEKYHGKNSRYTCPACDEPHQFTRYIDEETGEYLADNVGICNRVTSCGYHYTPKDYFQDNKLLSPPNTQNPVPNTNFQKPKPTANGQLKPITKNLQSKTQHPIPNTQYSNSIPPDIFQKTLGHYDQNNLITYLKTIFDENTVSHLANIYKIGTSKHFGGGTTIFWQIDTQGNIRTGKLIKYNAKTGKRIKKPFVATNWVHTLQYKDKFNLRQCLFGEHLLAEDPTAPVALVESEKTAIIAQSKIPNYIWLATGSLNEFKPSKLEILKNRIVVAFPDLGAYNIWKKKASEISFHISVSDFLEQNATDEQRKKGLDIADFL